MYQRTAEKLRRELEGVQSRQGRCFPRDLKERAAAWLVERRAAGTTVAALASELGLSSGTVLKWSSVRGRSSRALVPVEIISEPNGRDSMSVVSPSGFRVDGLSLSEVVTLLKALG